ncbi:MAG: hypothetical protein AB7Q42_21430 [Acidimicrobiia bacterium]
MKDDEMPRPAPDRMPTPEEERAAERGAAEVDIDEVTKHEEEMAELGANVKGEGEITPSAPT